YNRVRKHFRHHLSSLDNDLCEGFVCPSHDFNRCLQYSRCTVGQRRRHGRMGRKRRRRNVRRWRSNRRMGRNEPWSDG
ncbi:hypothetical protein PMAYCL1PPCAC_27413, partial [Pristionchus mayeri]